MSPHVIYSIGDPTAKIIVGTISKGATIGSKQTLPNLFTISILIIKVDYTYII